MGNSLSRVIGAGYLSPRRGVRQWWVSTPRQGARRIGQIAPDRRADPATAGGPGRDYQGGAPKVGPGSRPHASTDHASKGDAMSPRRLGEYLGVTVALIACEVALLGLRRSLDGHAPSPILLSIRV